MSCNIIAGPHNLYYAPYGTTSGGVTYLGRTTNGGITMIRDILTQEITADQMGEGIVDYVYEGSNLTLEFTMLDLNTTIAQQFLHPFQCTYASGKATDVTQEDYGVAGRTACAVYGVLEAIPLAYSSAAAFDAGANAPGVAGTYPTSAGTLAGRHFRGLVVGTLNQNLDSKASVVPVRFQCLPFVVSNVNKQWIWVEQPSSSLSITW